MNQDLNDELAQVSTTLFTQRGIEKGGVDLMPAVSWHKNSPLRTSARPRRVVTHVSSCLLLPDQRL